jgi:hypothetical protein
MVESFNAGFAMLADGVGGNGRIEPFSDSSSAREIPIRITDARMTDAATVSLNLRKEFFLMILFL